MSSAYLDVAEFLTDTQKLPCKVLYDIPNCGHFEGTAEKHLRAGTNLELPYWLAGTLYQKDMVDISLPRAYTARVRNALSASPDSVNLRNLGGGGGAFYAGGHKLTSISEDLGLVKTLHGAFKGRLREIMDQSQHTSADSGGEAAAYEFCQSLDAWERELFTLGEAAAKEVKVWSQVKATKAAR